MADHNARAHALADFFTDANPNDVEDLLKVMQGDREHVDELAEILFAAWWAGFDPQGALEGRMLANWAGRYPWIRTVVKEWGRREPEPARQAVAKMDENQVEPHQVAVNSLIGSRAGDRTCRPGPRTPGAATRC